MNPELITAIEAMQHMTIFHFENEKAVAKLVKNGGIYKADLSDILIANCAEQSGSESGLNFDKAAAKLPFFTLIK